MEENSPLPWTYCYKFRRTNWLQDEGQRYTKDSNVKEKCKSSRVENQGSNDYGFKVIRFLFNLSMAEKMFSKKYIRF